MDGPQKTAWFIIREKFMGQYSFAFVNYVDAKLQFNEEEV